MSAHTTDTQLRLIGKLLLEGELHCETGLHVGAGQLRAAPAGSDVPNDELILLEVNRRVVAPRDRWNSKHTTQMFRS